MIDTTPFDACECRSAGNPKPLCQTALSLQEQGKKIQLIPRAREQAKAIVFDGCVCTDNDIKCDALFLFANHKRKVAALVELKGAANIEHAYAQLAKTRLRPAYKHLTEQLDRANKSPLTEKAFVVSNGMLSKPHSERLEKQHGLRVKQILHAEPGSKVSNLRDWF